jgi:nanoRNase/pAp phosphatase (c-di-AMP/oligoRNAs hydrolase)
VPETSAFEVEIASEKLKRYKSPGTDEVLVELIKAGGEQFNPRSIILLILLGIRTNCQRSGRSRS